MAEREPFEIRAKRNLVERLRQQIKRDERTLTDRIAEAKDYLADQESALKALVEKHRDDASAAKKKEPEPSEKSTPAPGPTKGDAKK